MGDFEIEPSVTGPQAPTAPSWVLTLDPEIKRFLEGAWSKSTRRAYIWAWGLFVEWCKLIGLPSTPAEPLTVIRWIAHATKSECSLGTVRAVHAAVKWIHEGLGFVTPTAHPLVKNAMQVAARELGKAPERQAAPITADLLERITVDIAPLDRAVILVGWHAALRRSELAALNFADVSETPGGIAIHIRKSKTDQERLGDVVGIKAHGNATCAVKALREWIAIRGEKPGPLFGFRGGRTVERRIRRAVELTGLDPEPFSGHSLRAGFITEAIRRGVSDSVLMGTTRHKSATMLAVYRREACPIARGASPFMGPRLEADASVSSES